MTNSGLYQIIQFREIGENLMTDSQENFRTKWGQTEIEKAFTKKAIELVNRGYFDLEGFKQSLREERISQLEKFLLESLENKRSKPRRTLE